MQEDSASPTARGRMTRRGLLALAGTSLLAGCNSLAGLGDGAESTIRANDLPDIDPDADRQPAVSESVPVDIAPAHFDAARSRVRTLLSELPTPLGPDDIPNGHIRERVSDAATNATTELNDARDAPTEFVALSSLQRARAEARFAAAGWAVVDRNLSVESLQVEHRQAVLDARSLRDGHDYVGSDPVRAALVHSRIEEQLEQVTDNRTPSAAQNSLSHVAEWGETAESAWASLDDARHLDEQFTASLPADAGTIEETLTGAAETLLVDVRSRKAEMPPEPTADDWDLPERVIGDFRRDVDHGITRIEDATGPASAVIDANRRRTELQALDRLQERIDTGELSRPESAEAVRQIRSTALDAIEGALAESQTPELTRTAVTTAAWRVANADWDLARQQGEVAVSALDRTVADYVIATAIAQVAPNIAGRTVETLENA